MQNRIRNTTAAALVAMFLFSSPASADAPTGDPLPPCGDVKCPPDQPPSNCPSAANHDPAFEQQLMLANMALRSEHRDLKHARHTVNVLERRIDAKDRLIRHLRAELRH